MRFPPNTKKPITVSLQEYIFKCANRMYTLEQFNQVLADLTGEQREQISYKRRQAKPNRAHNHFNNPREITIHMFKEIHRFYRNGGTLADIYKLFDYECIYGSYELFYSYVHGDHYLSRALLVIDANRAKSNIYKTIRTKLVKEYNEFKKRQD